MKEQPEASATNSYPVAKADRRVRNLSRPNPGNRRNYLRYFCDFPLIVRFDSLSGQVQEVSAKVKDISEGGLMLEGLDIPDGVSEVTLKFQVPAGVMPEEFVQGEWILNATIRYRHPSGNRYGIEFEEPLGKRLARTTWAYLRWGGGLFFLAVLSIVLVMKYESFYFEI